MISSSIIQEWRSQFPILLRQVYDKPLVYLDNAATTQKPQCVIDAVSSFYSNSNSNIHRGVHALSQEATVLFEHTRKIVANFINAANSDQIVFTKGATDAINLVANSFSKNYLQKGDEIILTQMEHHANIVPWQLQAEYYGFTIKVIPMNSIGELDLSTLDSLITKKTKLVSCIYVSNALGIINPIDKIIEAAHSRNIPVLIDASQAIQHMHIDVQKLDCDFLVFSGHKIYSPSGTGVLYAKKYLLEQLPPYQGGGDMILKVQFDKTIFAEPPHKFEAGTPNIEGFIGLGKGIEFIQSIGLDTIALYEQYLLNQAENKLSSIPGVEIIGKSENKTAVVSFIIKDIHPHDIASLLDRSGVAVRAGHHCAQPIMQHFGISSTTRASMAFYNTEDELNYLCSEIEKIITLFS